MRLFAILVAWFASGAAPAGVGPDDITPFTGGRFVFGRADNGECVVALQGAVTPAADAAFDAVVEQARARGCTRPVTLLLESPGGDVGAGLSIGRSARMEGMRTVARYACASSCANIFLGGVERVLWGSRAMIGLHQPYRARGPGAPRDEDCYTTNFDRPVVAMRRYMEFVLPETHEQVLQLAMATPCKSVTWVKGSRAVEIGIATHLEAERLDVFGSPSKRAAAAAAAAASAASAAASAPP